MNEQKFKELLTTLKDLNKKGDEWLDKVPSEINSVFFDNTYCDNLRRSTDALIHYIFDETLVQELDWFLYEWSPEKSENQRTIWITLNFDPNTNTAYIINDVDDFVRYLKAECEVEFE